MEYPPFQFLCPFNSIICGASQSGKTTLVRELLNNLHVLDTPMTQVIWCYGIDSVNKPVDGVTLVEGLPDLEMLKHTASDGKHRLLILDDLLIETMESKEKKIRNLFLLEV